ncbi:MAG: beta-N-acetylhexosaminidase [Chloroflexi bacterium]|nr:beta-N-acetylhexosaminidase [Chloroflexota bacterium]
MTVDAWLARMTLAEKAGQVMAFGFDGTALTDDLRRMLEQIRPGGVVLFARNVVSPAQLAQLTADLQQTAQANGGPRLIISIDQEGGRVARLRRATGFTEFPSAQAVGAAVDPPGTARAIARAMATEMRAAGITMDLAPVLDVNNNPANPVIGNRSFGDDPALVAACGVAFIEALQAEGIMTVGKHFPGHGDTSVDSHLGLPVIPHDRARLEQVEFIPFKAAIAAGVAGIMSAHISFPAIDPMPNMPATLSPNVMTGLLRDELQYGGLRLTDSLEMGALQASGYPVPVAAATALAAGADLLLFNCGHALNYQAHTALQEGVRYGEIPSARLDEAVRRVLQAKARFGLWHTPG